MQVCQTCGKVLKDSTEEFHVNGIVQCENCAYPNTPKKSNTPIKNDDVVTSKKVSTPWIDTLKTACRISIFIGIVASIIFGICVYNLIYGDIATLLAIIVVVVGIGLSFLNASLLMVFANLAEDVAIIRHFLNK